jgi:CO/xanthine dehydrogenase Mo-binding subunit
LGTSPDTVVWKDGKAFPAGAHAGSFEPLPLAEIALKSGRTGVRSPPRCRSTRRARDPALLRISATSRSKILRYTAVQDVGLAIHPSYIEGQIQGGVTQGIGWGLNEEYIYDKDGRLENPGFLDYRMPVAPEVPTIDAVMTEVPNPRHPFGAPRCRRSADRNADGGSRQRDQRPDRRPNARPADVAPAAARGDRPERRVAP